jgi:hypothetical protein
LALIEIVQADSDPFGTLAAYDQWATQFATLDPPEGYEGYHDQWLTALEGQRDVFRELLESADPQAALGEFMEKMTDLTSAMVDLGQTESDLTVEILREREGDPEAEYFVARAGITSEGGASNIFEGLFAALGGMLDDPAGSLETMASLIDTADSLMKQWDDLEPPPNLEDLHHRQIKTWNETVELFASLVGALESDEPPPPTATLLLQELSEEAPLLNAEWTLATAAALRGDDSSGLQGRWHRDNYGEGHEQLFCTGSTSTVQCRYLSRSLTDPTSVGTGRFVGFLVDADACLPYMSDTCSSAIVIAQGREYFSFPQDGQELVVPVTMAVLPEGKLALSWDEHPSIPGGEFHCPWYRVYATALAMDHKCTPEPWK